MIYSVLSSIAKESGGVPKAVYKRFNTLSSKGYETTIFTLSYQKKFDDFKEWFYENKLIDRNVNVISLINEIESIDGIKLKKVHPYKKKIFNKFEVKNKNKEYSDFYKNNKLFFREEYANGKLRAVREYHNGFHYLTVINNSKALLKVKIVKNKWISAEIPNTKYKFNSMQDFYYFILSKKIKNGDIIFSEFRDKGLPYLPGGGLDNIVTSLDDDIKKLPLYTPHTYKHLIEMFSK